MPKQAIGYAAYSATSPLKLFHFERRDLRPFDVQIEILYCGICHSDLHLVRSEWKWAPTQYPIVPGHEIIGRVVAVGSKVKKFKPGQLVGVGCMVDSCRKCGHCKDHLEQYCSQMTLTFNGIDKQSGQVTYGGYSNLIVVDEKFVLKVPSSFKEKDISKIAPLLCAGITTYSPLKHWKVGKGSKVGVVGLGGLGHMAIKIAKALGAKVVLFTTSPSKIADGKRLGAKEVVLSKNPEEMKKHVNSFDFIIDTVAFPHNLDDYIQLLKRDGTLCVVGLPSEKNPAMDTGMLISGRKQVAGSVIGGLKETQEMLNFCAKHKITADVELIPIQKVNEAYERMLKSDVKYRFVIDISTLKNK